jgi:hypothetical protein
VLLLVAGAIAGTGLLRHTRGPLVPRISPLHSSGSPSHSHQHRSGVETLPDGFEVRTLRPGQKPPQFVLVSFDGAGWADMWDFWFGVAEKVPFRFTAFLSGTYLLSDRTAGAYHPPYYPAGTSEISWYAAADLPVEIANLNRALAEGDEIGTHFNGHFCSGAGLPSGGNTWTTADWDTELTQFFSLLRGYRSNNHLPARDHLDVTPADVHGARTPCLEGIPDQLYPALRAHGLTYDSSFSHPGLAWPQRRGGLWEIGMATYPIHGTLPDGRTGVPVTTMDYNYYFTQRGASDAGLSTADSDHDRDQVLATYRDLYQEAFHGNRAPLVLGNHFNDWNRNAYRDALASFVTETCGRPETQCITYSDLVAWLEAQRPSVLRSLTTGARSSGSPATSGSGRSS